METPTIESIEFKVDENTDEEHLAIDIKQETVEIQAMSSNNEEPEGKDELVVITSDDLAGMSDQIEQRLTEFSIDHDKVYEEWIYVDVDKSTYEVKENVLLLSSVYGNNYPCCSVM
ncbi:uncharacterized protein LOC141894399 [Acropora palmata]